MDRLLDFWMRLALASSLVLICLFSIFALGAPRQRALEPEDFALFKEVSEPNISPDGEHVVYVVRTTDLEKDKRPRNLWLARFDGSENRALTFGDKSQTHPRFSPDGKWIAFLSNREDENEVSQLWIFSASGGEAEKITHAKGAVEDFAWSPDSKKIVLVVHDPEPDDGNSEDKKSNEKSQKPIVIDRFAFKKDYEGYITSRFSHLYVLDLASRKIEQLTNGKHDELLPSWSPGGKEIAFVTKRGEDPDRNENWDIHIIGANKGAKERQITTSINADADPDWNTPPKWSPNGKTLGFIHGGDPKLIAYATNSIALISTSGREQSTNLAQKLDRNVSQLKWASDGKWIYTLVEDDGSKLLYRINLKNQNRQLITPGRREVDEFDMSSSGRLVVSASTPERPFEIFAVENGEFRNLSRQNDEVLKQFKLAHVEETRFKSKDGTEVHGFFIPPLEHAGTTKPPALLMLHGGPQSQYANSFSFDKQLFAAKGFAVIMPNPRGSTGRGTDYSMGIYADWGRRDVEDDLAAVDDAVSRNLVDPERLGVGGWSYGGISTNYIIATTTRFKAAVSGASISNVFAGYGTDQYIIWYEAELGSPWKNPKTWARVSFPFFHADRIKTPTLFLCGDSDLNVPLLNSEQMYQALRSQDIPTQLVIYPGQYHGFSKPSYIIDRFHRYLDWYSKWILKQDSRKGP